MKKKAIAKKALATILFVACFTPSALAILAVVS